MNSIYHVYNKGIEKRFTFEDKKDLDRFVAILDYYRFKNPTVRFSFRKRLKDEKQKNLTPIVEVISYCLMPNHFHLLLAEKEKNGVSIFLSKISNSYTKYFNSKYKRQGPLFKGTFKSAEVKDKEELLNISRYIHLNPLLDHIVSNLKKFPYSSYVEYIELADGFCEKKTILKEFSNANKYESFVLNQEDYTRSLKTIEKLLLE